MTRDEKVEALKSKIDTEIQIYKELHKNAVSLYDKETFYDCFVVVVLEDWIKTPLAFRDYRMKDLNDDNNTQYILSESRLDVLLDDDFNVLGEIFGWFYTNTHSESSRLNLKKDCYNLLSDDRFFEINLISIISEILYEKKQKGELV